MADVNITGIQELQQGLNTYLRGVSNPKQKIRILAAGGQVIKRTAAKAPTPKSKKVHYYYPKKGANRVAIFPGNLRKSIKVFRGKDGDIYVGPKVLRRLSGLSEIGKNAKTSSGYYASMIYGKASRFRIAILENAIATNSAKILNAIQTTYAKIHRQTTR